jgi:predicted branched-subunit amino acid permease
MSKKSKPTQPASEKLAQAIEQCLPVLLSNVPMAMASLPNAAKLGFAMVSVSVVAMRIAVGAAAWLVRTKF